MHYEMQKNPLQEEHYQILDKAMTEAGFVGYVNEWWDYRDSQMDEYEPLLADRTIIRCEKNSRYLADCFLLSDQAFPNNDLALFK